MALMYAECCFRNVYFCHSYLMESLLQIQFRKLGDTTELIEKFIYGWHRKMVIRGDCIEGPVVHTTPPTTILLLYQ
ncbi:hypothetical protein AAZX31_07G205600 [Glycine max]